ncbi:methylated-DNA-protein-cysteine methyltransferase-like protein [Pullulanibacillus pueri]|uniref:Methylated-DNA-[protein]-cysteine S-methyltransferase DNA binding domain-containing protein n=1 Tax=Pullulanibacillus pueri TaxID=1437324 RepID=A0A8J2ZVJ8_9BACL|nr:MGMT family protein [Pullulanibacillus pueri]MBM7682462.1 methylated-DNA-protein-cysteine methyltransferase-like protein [Pullulanibacillus pueri]GGH81542.1 hypothetical protein GCM10007096_19590 [Pullulanibacillus pueri]
MEDFTLRVIEIIKNIPKGQVMTYGQIARLAGSPRGARQVVRILHSSSKKHNLPWHRVINVKGKIAIKEDEHRFIQKITLENEGILFKDDDTLELSKYQYHPESSCNSNTL